MALHGLRQAREQGERGDGDDNMQALQPGRAPLRKARTSPRKVRGEITEKGKIPIETHAISTFGT